MEFLSAFEVPTAAIPVIDRIVAPEEIVLIESVSERSFDSAGAAAALEAHTGEEWPSDRVTELLLAAYRRGILLAEDERLERFEIGAFYGRLDVFAVTEPEAYLALPRESQLALDAWYFKAYCDGLGDDPEPSGDRMATLAQTLDYIDTVDRQIWLNRCDCRTLAGHCDTPTDTCITFRNGINTLVHRGWSRPLTKDEAKDVVRRSNRAGLMHTLNDNGICNCCRDCCYLFRAQEATGRSATWPHAEDIAVLDPEACIACGKCVKRCPFDAFELLARVLVQHPERCRGCGLCIETCPTRALAMRPRDRQQGTRGAVSA